MNKSYAQESEDSMLLTFLIGRTIWNFICKGEGWKIAKTVLDTKSEDNKSKNRQMELHWTQKLLYGEGNLQQSEKVTYGMAENICKACIY